MISDRQLQKMNPFAVIFVLYLLSALLSCVCNLTSYESDFYNAWSAYLLGILYLPLSLTYLFSQLGTPSILEQIIVVIILVFYWPVSLFLKYRYIKTRKTKWLFPVVIIILLPAIKIAQAFAISMSVWSYEGNLIMLQIRKTVACPYA